MPRADLITHDDEIEDVFHVEHPQAQPKTKQQKRTEDMVDSLNDLSDDAYIAVYKQKGTGKESMSLVGKWPGDEFDSQEDLMLFLRDKYGAGSYRVHVRINGKVRSNTLLSVEAPLENVSRETTNDGATAALLAQIEKQNQMIAGLYQKMADRPQNDQSEESFLQKMLMYKQLFDNGAQPSRGISDIARDLGALKEIGIDIGLGGQTEKDESFMDLALPVLEVLKQNNQNPQGQPEQRKPNPQPRNPKEQAEMFKALKIKQGLKFLIDAASKGAEPSLYAELAVNQFDQAFVDEFIQDPRLLEKAINIDPRAANFKPWLDDLKEHINALYGRESKYKDEYSDFQNSDESVINGETSDSDSQKSDDI